MFQATPAAHFQLPAKESGRRRAGSPFPVLSSLSSPPRTPLLASTMKMAVAGWKPTPPATDMDHLQQFAAYRPEPGKESTFASLGSPLGSPPRHKGSRFPERFRLASTPTCNFVSVSSMSDKGIPWGVPLAVTPCAVHGGGQDDGVLHQVPSPASTVGPGSRDSRYLFLGAPPATMEPPVSRLALGRPPTLAARRLDFRPPQTIAIPENQMQFAADSTEPELQQLPLPSSSSRPEPKRTAFHPSPRRMTAPPAATLLPSPASTTADAGRRQLEESRLGFVAHLETILKAFRAVHGIHRNVPPSARQDASCQAGEESVVRFVPARPPEELALLRAELGKMARVQEQLVERIGQLVALPTNHGRPPASLPSIPPTARAGQSASGSMGAPEERLQDGAACNKPCSGSLPPELVTPKKRARALAQQRLPADSAAADILSESPDSEEASAAEPQRKHCRSLLLTRMPRLPDLSESAAQFLEEFIG